MKFSLVTCALIAGVIAGLVPAKMYGKLAEERIVSAEQQFSPAATVLTASENVQIAVVPDSDPEETGSIGMSLTCEQIRIMDEVEFITDDSYCTERS
jgi:hypothetical protein